MAFDSDAGSGVDGALRERLARIRSVDTLEELTRQLDASSERDAYFQAKRDWADRPEVTSPVSDGFPGDHVRVGDTNFFVHGVTHANTDAERRAVREHVSRPRNRGDAIYCEQGIREMYLADFESACAMDDYRWARKRADELGIESRVEELPTSEFEALVQDVASVTDEFREAAYWLIESGSALYGEGFTMALGDVASSILASPEDLATGEDFEAFRRTRAAAENPDHLGQLQDYYRRVLLPQPLERDWLRRHDRELELVTHARNERMADYLVHEADATAIEVIVGAAHQPGVTYYLERYRDGHRRPGEFEYVE